MRKLILVAVLMGGCTDSSSQSIEIPFDLFASDELGSSSGVCGFSPVTQASGVYKGSGFLELDPAINPNPEYNLGLQVENYLEDTPLTDSNGNALSGVNVNDFEVRSAIISYFDTEGALAAVPKTTVLVSGTVRPGGSQNASVIAVPAVPSLVAQSWVSSFNTSDLQSENVVLEVQLVGVLTSGESITSGVFHFPITLCFDCGGVSPTSKAGSGGCATQSVAVASGHGPCCSSQDFTDICLPCGQLGQPCCSGSSCDNSLGLTCSGTPTTTSATELCNFPNEPSVVCAKPS